MMQGYVLAGGKSSRMGTDKAFLKIGEKTFIENAVEILKPNCQKVTLVLNNSQTDFSEKLPFQIPKIFDIYENRGALGGIHAALKDCKTEFAVILAVDLPFVKSDVIAKLYKIISLEEEISAVVPRQSDERLQPLCAIYRVKDCLLKLEEILSNSNSASVRDLLFTVKTEIVNADKLSDKENLFANLNYFSDYKNLFPQ